MSEEDVECLKFLELKPQRQGQQTMSAIEVLQILRRRGMFSANSCANLRSLLVKINRCDLAEHVHQYMDAYLPQVTYEPLSTDTEADTPLSQRVGPVSCNSRTQSSESMGSSGYQSMTDMRYSHLSLSESKSRLSQSTILSELSEDNWTKSNLDSLDAKTTVMHSPIPRKKVPLQEGK